MTAKIAGLGHLTVIYDIRFSADSKRRMIMSTKTNIAVAVAIAALFLTANEASAQPQHRGDRHTNVRHLPRAFQGTYGYVPRQAPQNGPTSDVYSSYSQGRQSYPNPDRDFSIENLRSHAN